MSDPGPFVSSDFLKFKFFFSFKAISDIPKSILTLLDIRSSNLGKYYWTISVFIGPNRNQKKWYIFTILYNIHNILFNISEVRNCTLDSICELASQNPGFALLCQDSIADMFNDEIESVRLNAINSLKKLSQHLEIREDQLDIMLGVLQVSIQIYDGGTLKCLLNIAFSRGPYTENLWLVPTILFLLSPLIKAWIIRYNDSWVWVHACILFSIYMLNSSLHIWILQFQYTWHGYLQHQNPMLKIRHKFMTQKVKARVEVIAPNLCVSFFISCIHCLVWIYMY